MRSSASERDQMPSGSASLYSWLVSGAPSDLTADVPEYAKLLPWERGPVEARFQFHLQQGQAARPDKPQIVRDRAIYFGYRGAYQRFVLLLVVVMVPIFVVSLFFHGSALNLFDALFVAVPVLWVGVFVARISRNKRMHPDYRHYKLDPGGSDWDFTPTSQGRLAA